MERKIIKLFVFIKNSSLVCCFFMKQSYKRVCCKSAADIIGFAECFLEEYTWCIEQSHGEFVMSKKVIAAGHICIDITPVFPDKKTANIGDVLKPGKLVEVEKAEISTGGSVANTGLAMKILGADVTLMGKLGCDEFGDMIYSILDKYNAAEGMIRADDVSTSYSTVIAIPGIDRIFLHNPGANDRFHAVDISEEALKEAALFHFGYPTLMRSMYENDGAELLAVFKKVKSCGCATSLDLSAVDASSDAGKADWEKILSDVLPYVDFFVPSIEELCFMLDRECFSEWQDRAVGGDITEVLDVEKDIKPLADKCMELGAKILLLKCGKPGLYFASAGVDVLLGSASHSLSSSDVSLKSETDNRKCGLGIGKRIELDIPTWANKSFFEKSYVPDKVLSGTGAGDTSIAAFLTAMLNGETPEVALQLAAGTGASCVAAYDALSGLKSFEELKEKINSGWAKNE